MKKKVMLVAVDLTAPTKFCSKCEQARPATSDFFRRNPMGALGLHSVCTTCQNRLSREKKSKFRAEHPDEARAIGRSDAESWRRRQGMKDAAVHREERLTSATKVCSKCGEEKLKRAFGTTSANTIDGLSSWCKGCVNVHAVVARDSTKWTRRLVAHAKERHLKMGFSAESFDLSEEYMVELFDRQIGLCYWFGTHMTQPRRSGLFQASLDRLDPDRGYVRNNVVLCTKAANLARNDASVAEFRAFVDRLAHYLKET